MKILNIVLTPLNLRSRKNLLEIYLLNPWSSRNLRNAVYWYFREQGAPRNSSLWNFTCRAQVSWTIHCTSEQAFFTKRLAINFPQPVSDQYAKQSHWLVISEWRFFSKFIHAFFWIFFISPYGTFAWKRSHGCSGGFIFIRFESSTKLDDSATDNGDCPAEL